MVGEIKKFMWVLQFYLGERVGWDIWHYENFMKEWGGKGVEEKYDNYENKAKAISAKLLDLNLNN